MITIDAIKLAVFDLDDTLYPESDYAQTGYRNVAAFLAADNASLADQLASKMKSLARAGRRNEVFQTILTDLSRPATDEAISQLIDLFRTSPRPLTLFPDAARALARFRQSGFSLAILTDGPIASQQNKIRLLDLDRQVDRVIYTDQYGPGFGKPCPHCFEVLMNEFHAQPHQCIYIADNETKDFFAPNALGWQSVKIVRPDGVYLNRQHDDARYKARHAINTLDDLTLT